MSPESKQNGTQRNRFGTFTGVFTPSILTILGVILFMRANFVVGQAGFLHAISILLIAKAITFATALSISAVSTNMQVRGGGFYYMISRVLGADFGGTIGVTLFLAQALSVPFYILGFTEALVLSFPAMANYFQAVSLSMALVLFMVTYFGAGWALRVQFVIMAFLGLAILAFLGGAATLFSTTRFMENFLPAYTSHVSENTLAPYTFWAMFALYFPAVTGIGTGVNMSGDLKEPARSIPRGTLAAVGVGFLIYAAQIVLAAGAYNRDEMIARPYLLLQDNALFGLAFLIPLGMVAASLSSALGSYLGAPRVLQAISRDRILPLLAIFAMGSSKGDEPRRGLILTMVITLVVLLWAGNGEGGAAFNAVAVLITMFFLYSYGMINLAAFIEGISNNPSFRPRFRYFHWTTALFGAAGSGAVAFLINPLAAFAALCIASGLLWYIRTKELKIAFGNVRRGFLFHSTRKKLLQLQQLEPDPKNWRPTILVFSGNPDNRELLVSYGVWLEAGRGIVYLANNLVGEFSELAARRRAAIRQLKKYCEENSVQAFPIISIARDREDGIMMILQMAASGLVRPNLVLLGWSEEVDSLASYCRILRAASMLEMSLVLLKSTTLPASNITNRIDVWWRGRKNGSLMMLLAYLLTKNWEWQKSSIRLLRVIEDEAGEEPAKKGLEILLETARISAQSKIIISTKPFMEILKEHSADASCLLLGFEIPDEEEELHWSANLEMLADSMPTTLFVTSSGTEDMLA